MQSAPWEFCRLELGDNRPRQFEFHPTIENILLCGTLRGDIVITRIGDDGGICKLYHGGYCNQGNDAILALSWLKTDPNLFISGSGRGAIRCGDWRYDSDVITNTNNDSKSIVHRYREFEKLTSVHVNCTDQRLLVSGYSNNARIYDVASGVVLHELERIHDHHINISRFANHSPHLFATSSFDKTAKMWDIRLPTTQPIYTVHSENGLIVLSFSPDDNFLLASAVDNEVTQYLTVDGSKHMQFKIPRTTLEGNYTRAYYSASGAYVFAGASEEAVTNVMCSRTGELVARTELYPDRKHASLYVQSLRGDPHSDRHLCVLTNYRDIADREIVSVKLATADIEGETYVRLSNDETDVIINDVPLPSSNLARDLHNGLLEGLHLDMLIHVQEQQFHCHSVIVRERCPAIEDYVRETQQSDIRFEVDLTDVIPSDRSDIFPLILRYFYTDDVRIAEVRRTCLNRLECPRHLKEVALQELEVKNTYTLDEYAYDASSFELDFVELEPNCDHREQLWRTVWAPVFIGTCADLMLLAVHLNLCRLQSIVDDVCSQNIMAHTIYPIWKIALDFGRNRLVECCRAYLSTHSDIVQQHCAAEQYEELLECAESDGYILRRQLSMTDVNFVSDDEPWHSDIDTPAFSKIPNFSFHSAISLSNNTIFVIGGRDELHYHNLRCVYTFNVAENGWSRIEAFGVVPTSVVYHTAAALEYKSPRHVMICEGKQIAYGGWRAEGSVYVLDAVTMMWTVAVTAGMPPHERCYHSMATIYAEQFDDLASLESAAPGSASASASSQIGKSIEAVWNFATMRSRHMASIPPYSATMPNEKFPVDISKNTRFIVFAGSYRRLNRDLKNDVFILIYHRTRLDQEFRNGNQQNTEVPFYSHGFLWVRPQVLGPPPPPRQAHAAATIIFPLNKGGPRMIVFGGVGRTEMFNDVASLRVAAINTVEWDQVNVQGTPPTPRHNHNLTAIPGRSTLILTGGAFQGNPCMDIHLLHVDASLDIVTVRWSSLNLTSPFLGYRLFPTAVLAGETLYLVGGAPVRSGHQIPGSPVHCIPLSATTDPTECRLCESFVYLPSCGMYASRHVPTLHADLHETMIHAKSTDLTIIPSSSTSNGSEAFNSEPLHVHKVVLSSRCPTFRAMLLGSMLEATTNVLRIQDVDERSLRAFIHFLYTDTVQCQASDLINLLTLANRYGVCRLVQFCEVLLCGAIDDDNWVDLLVLADTMMLRTLGMICKGYVIRRWDDLATPDRLESLPTNIVQSLEELKQSKSQVYVANFIGESVRC